MLDFFCNFALPNKKINTTMGIFNSNDYKRGYEDGYRDAKAGKEKSYVSSGKSMKYWINGDAAIDTYNQGYDEGYRIGMRDRCRDN